MKWTVKNEKTKRCVCRRGVKEARKMVGFLVFEWEDTTWATQNRRWVAKGRSVNEVVDHHSLC